jgi:hypothetical protein
VIGIEFDHAVRGLARFAALFRRFNSMADRIADQVRQRLGDGVEDAFVEIGILSADSQLDIATTLP